MRHLFPDEGSRLAYRVNGGYLGALPAATAVFYTDAAGTALADLRAYNGTTTVGAAVSGSALLVDENSLLPLFWGPDGVDTLYVRLNGGPASPVLARFDERVDNAAPRNEYGPADGGYKAWAFDPVAVQSSSTPPAGQLVLVALRFATRDPISRLYNYVSTAGVAVTNAFMALFGPTGTLLAQSDNQAANMASTGLKTHTLTAPQTPDPALTYHAGIWITATTTIPALARAASSALVYAKQTTPAFRFAVADSGLTATAPAATGVRVQTPNAYWVGAD